MATSKGSLKFFLRGAEAIEDYGTQLFHRGRSRWSEALSALSPWIRIPLELFGAAYWPWCLWGVAALIFGVGVVVGLWIIIVACALRFIVIYVVPPFLSFTIVMTYLPPHLWPVANLIPVAVLVATVYVRNLPSRSSSDTDVPELKKTLISDSGSSAVSISEESGV